MVVSMKFVMFGNDDSSFILLCCELYVYCRSQQMDKKYLVIVKHQKVNIHRTISPTEISIINNDTVSMAVSSSIESVIGVLVSKSA